MQLSKFHGSHNQQFWPQVSQLRALHDDMRVEPRPALSALDYYRNGDPDIHCETRFQIIGPFGRARYEAMATVDKDRYVADLEAFKNSGPLVWKAANKEMKLSIPEEIEQPDTAAEVIGQHEAIPFS
ncbi:MAG: hypothetical protein M1839_000309 [Geoglossum umbratile]|nr:MAG: hypothetical protein M1839_000309 [Geoglossum umbratile]